jgi:hypothetical protein
MLYDYIYIYRYLIIYTRFGINEIFVARCAISQWRLLWLHQALVMVEALYRNGWF